MTERLTSEMKEMVSQMRDLMKSQDFPLTAEVIDLAPEDIRVWQPISPDTVVHIANRLAPKRKWPHDMPLVVVARHKDGAYELLDGNHRRAAALKKKLRKMPAIVIPWETVEYMMRSFLDLDDMFEVIALESPVMEENQKLRDLEGNL